MRRTALWGAVLAATAAGSAWADDYHYNNILIGDRASGMGGAYTAVSDDPSGLYYNPAGVAYSNRNNLSASVNAYNSTAISYKGVLGGGNWNRTSSNLLPNFFGVVQPLSKGVVGFSYAVTDSILENQDEHFTNIGTITDFVLNVNNEDNTYKLGPSYAQQITDNLAVGITLYLHMRSSETIVNQQIDISGQPHLSQIGYLQTDETGIEPILGVMWSPMDKLSLGASLRQTSIISSSIKNQLTTDTTTGFINSTDSRAYPLELSLGAAYFASDRLLYSADFNYYSKASGQVNTSTDNPLRSKAATWNASAGVEYYVDSSWAFRGGVFTNRANTPTVKSGGTNQPEHVDLLGASFSVSRFTRNSSITAGFAYAQGNGKAQPISDVTNIYNESANSLTLFLSTSYSY